jgi:hypothetical protein
MGFSFADRGFWRLATVTFLLELLHLVLEPHWPAIQRSGRGTPAGTFFMSLEALVLFITLSAAIGLVTRMARVLPRPDRRMAIVVLAALGLFGVLVLVWQR